MFQIHEEPITKITLYDENCSPLFDGVVDFFTEDLDKFEQDWRASGRVDDETYERFCKSKNGGIVTDWYTDNPDFDIVQRGNATTYGERVCDVESSKFYITNAYGYQTTCFVKKLNATFRWIGFHDKYYRIASFQANGICVLNRATSDRWVTAPLFGNPVLKYVKGDAIGWSGSDNPEDFGENILQSICFLVNAEFGCSEAGKCNMKKDLKKFELTPEVLDRLFADIVGEAG